MENLLNSYKQKYNSEYFNCHEKQFLDILEDKDNKSFRGRPLNYVYNSDYELVLKITRLENCFTLKTGILENLDFNSFEIQNVESLFLDKNIDETKVPKDKIYNRFMFPIELENGNIREYRNYLSIIEGFYFENDSVDKVIVCINGNKINIPKVGEYFLNSFPILLDCLFFNKIIFTFFKDGNQLDTENVNGKMIGGFLPQKITNYIFKNDKIMYCDGTCSISKELIMN